MTRERLMLLPTRFLKEIAEKEGIKIQLNTGKDVLINLILEAMEEDCQEREKTNNPLIKIKEKKYEITMDEEIEAQDKTEYPIPERYNETIIVMMLRDPLWAFAYWDIKDKERHILKEKDGFQYFFLRIYEMLGCEFKKENIVDYFDIPINFSDSSWYINLPDSGKKYCMELIARIDGSNNPLCRSNIIKSPLFDISGNKPENTVDKSGNDLLVLSALYDFNSYSYGNKIPQRIISILDNHYLRFKD